MVSSAVAPILLIRRALATSFVSLGIKTFKVRLSNRCNSASNPSLDSHSHPQLSPKSRGHATGTKTMQRFHPVVNAKSLGASLRRCLPRT